MKVGKEAEQEVLQEYRGKILPPNHPITKRVTNVASRIITAAKLGNVKNASQVAYSEGGGWDRLPGSFGADEESFGSSNTWDHGASDAQRSVIERLRQEWEVVVIQDDKTPNAFVTGGTCITRASTSEGVMIYVPLLVYQEGRSLSLRGYYPLLLTMMVLLLCLATVSSRMLLLHPAKRVFNTLTAPVPSRNSASRYPTC